MNKDITVGGIMDTIDMNIKTIVMTLRHCGVSMDVAICKSCPLWEEPDCSGRLMIAAADKLEEINDFSDLQAAKLLKRVQELEIENELLKDALKKTE